MGGNAFPRPAKRLTTAQLGALTAHATSRLARFFSGVSPLRDARDKADHGDLDLICGWDHHRAWNWTGEERGVCHPALGLGGDMALVQMKAVELVGKEGWADGMGGAEKEKKELQRWCYDIALAVEAAEWVRRGSEISLAIPCRVFGDHMVDDKAFYQLDLPLVPANSLDFYLITVSYSTTFLILARAVRCISPSLTLQMTGLIVRHAAYPGISGIDVRLTSSADELCAYLGLRRAVWDGGFDTEQDCWAWLADVVPGGRLEGAYRKMVKPKAVRQKGHKSKAGGLDAFVAYLRTTKWGEGWDKDADVARVATPVEQTVGELGVPPLSPSSRTTGITASLPAKPATHFCPVAEVLNPARPVPLDERALAAMDRWGKADEYEAILAQRRAEATILAEQQQRKLQHKLNALEMARRKAEAEEAEVGLVGRLQAATLTGV